MLISKKLVSICLVILLLLTSIPSFAAVGDQSEFDSDSFYKIQNKWKGNYLYEDSSGNVNYGFTAIDDQSAQWSVEAAPGGSGYKRIKNRATGHYITVSDVSARRDPLTAKAIGTSTIDDQWIIEDATRVGNTTIRSSKWPTSNYFIHVEDQLGFAEVSADIGFDWESPQWAFVPVVDEVPVKIYNKFRNQYLYEVIGGEHNGKIAFGSIAFNEASSQWFLETVSENPDGSKVIRLKNKATGHHVTQEADFWLAIKGLDDSTTNSQWLMEASSSSGYVTMKNVAELANSKTFVLNTQFDDIFARSNDWSNPGLDNAHWRIITAADVNPVRLANYQYISDEGSKVYLYEENGLVKYGAPASVTDAVYQWVLEDYNGNRRIRNLASGNYMSSEGLTQATDPLGSTAINLGSLTTQWNVTESDLYDDFVSFQSVATTLNYIHIQDRTGSAQSSEIASADSDAQWFIEDPTAASGGDNPYVMIINNWNSLYLYEDEDMQLKYGNARTNDLRAQWLVESYNGRKRIQNRATGHYMNMINQTDGYIQVSPVDFAGDPDSTLGALWRIKDNAGVKSIWNATDLNNIPGSSKYLNVQNLAKYAEYSVINPNWGSASWRYVAVTDEIEYVRIKNKESGTYLYAANGLVKYGTPDENDQQSHWLLVDAGGGAQYIQNRSNGQYISMEGMDLDNTLAPLKVMDIEPGWASPKWFVQDASTPGYVIFRNGWTGQHYINLKDRAQTDFAQSNLSHEIGLLDSAQFLLEVAPDVSQYVRIKNKTDGTFLFEEDGKVIYGDVSISNPVSHWYIADTGSGDDSKFIINRTTGHYIAMEGMDLGNPLDYVRSMVIDPAWGINSPKWFVQDAATPGYKVFRNGWTGQHYLNVKDHTGYVQSNSSHEVALLDSAQFSLEAVPAGQLILPSGYIRIKNIGNDQFLYESYSNVVLYGDPADNNAYSHWILEDENGVKSIKNRATGNYMSVTGDYSYIETMTVTGAAYSPSDWAIEGAPVGDNFLIRSNHGSFKDEYMNTEGGLGYPERGLYPFSRGTLQWAFLPALSEAVTPSPPNAGDVETTTKVLNDSNYIRIKNKASGKYLFEDNGGLLYGTTEVSDQKSHWLLQDYNGRKLIQNRSTGSYVSITDDTLDVASNGSSKGIGEQWIIDEILGYKQISSAKTVGHNLYEDGSMTAVQHGSQTDNNAKWVFEEVSDNIRYEAEKAYISGGAKASGNYVSNLTDTGTRIIFAVNAQSEGDYNTTIQYSNSTQENKTLSLLVNGIPTQTISFSPASSTVSVVMPLRAGYNSVSLEKTDADSGRVAIDYITVQDSTNLVYRGADLPYVTYEAEHGTTNGTLIGPSRVYLDVAAEASRREAVRLDQTGQYVEVETAKAANSVVVRYSIPDSLDGEGLQATLGLYINGQFKQNLDLTSRYAWVYGNYPWSNDPKQGSPHRFFDEVHVLLDEEIPAGATVKLQKDAGNTADYYVIDLIDLEQAPENPYPMPEGHVSIIDFGATSNGGDDDTQALKDAIAAAKTQSKAVWIPAGSFDVGDGLLILDDITIRGAGMWHTTLKQAKFFGNGSNIKVFDFLLDGELNVRDDQAQTNGFEGAFGPGSTIQQVWIEHTKTGMWLTRPINKFGYEFNLAAYTDSLYVAGGRIRNVMADGMNFAVNTKNSMAEHMNIRYSGDDALAMWSFVENVPTDFTENNAYRFNTAQLPWLANNIIIFGGKGHKVQDNIVMDNIKDGAGISISTKFTPSPYQGTILVERNTMIRAGARDPGLNMNVGALWVYAFDRNIDTEVIIRSNVALDSTYHGLSIQGGQTLGSISSSLAKVTVEDFVIDGAGLTGVEVASTIKGAINFNNVIIRNTKLGDISNKAGSNFLIHKDAKADKPDSGDGSGDTQNGGTQNGGTQNGNTPKGNQDIELESGVNSGKNKINFEGDSQAKSFEVKLSVGAILKAASVNEQFVIVVKHKNATYELPVNILDILMSNNDIGFDLSTSILVIRIDEVEQSTVDTIQDKSIGLGMKVVGVPVEFQVILQNGDQTAKVTSFGNTYVTRTLELDDVVEPTKATVLVYDPVTANFQYVPAVFNSADGKTAVTIKSTSNSIYLVAENEQSFSDITSHWAKQDIELLASKLVAFGKTDSVFAPNHNITRAEFTALLVRALGLKSSGDKAKFNDVKVDNWFYKDVNTAVQFGLVSGYSDGSFKPNQTITREQMASLAARAMKSIVATGASTDLTRYADYFQLSNWSIEDWSLIVGEGIMKGKADNHLAPLDLATRAEAVVVIKKLLQKTGLIN